MKTPTRKPTDLVCFANGVANEKISFFDMPIIVERACGSPN
jgi:hypothetical protein